MEDIAQLGSPIPGAELGSPEFMQEPLEMLGMMDHKELSKHIYGEKTIDFGDLSKEMEVD
jgi:hypothetical protein